MGGRNWWALPCVLVMTSVLHADDKPWQVLLGPGRGLEAWQEPTGDWQQVGGLKLDADNPRLFVAEPGEGIWYNGPKGRTRDLLSKTKFGDIEAHVEFLIPKGSNSGVKFQGLYEIQIHDSHHVEKPDGTHCGGIYPRAELLPRYHHIDKGIAPKVNAARPAGEWQTLDVIFQAPRFDADGKKTANARFVKVVLNGELIHDNVEVAYPTGHAWKRPEVLLGPLLLQADHGPVAFRNVRVRPYE
ncbi:MAG: DUF1080 domain-containing protein [Gemmataceae bacterium]